MFDFDTCDKCQRLFWADDLAPVRVGDVRLYLCVECDPDAQ